MPVLTFTQFQATYYYRSPVDLSVWKAHHAPIFFFDNNLFPHQCGRAWITAAQEVALLPYASCTNKQIDFQSVWIYPADVPLLWALIPPSEREILRSQVGQLGQKMIKQILIILDSSYFKSEYGVELEKILRDALRYTWQTPAVQSALLKAVREIDLNSVNQLVNNLWPVLVEKTESGLWLSLRQIADLLLLNPGQIPEGSLTSRILQDLIKDPRSLSYLLNWALELTNQPEVVHFVTFFIKEMSIRLIMDPRWPSLINRAMLDRKWVAFSQKFDLNVSFLTRDLPRSLLRYRYPKDHNPLVAYLVRNIVHRRDTFVVMILRDTQLNQVIAHGMNYGTHLTVKLR